MLGGAANDACDDLDGIGAGYTNQIGGGDAQAASESFIGGGSSNTVTAGASMIGAGYANSAGGSSSFVGAGYYGAATGFASFIGSGGGEIYLKSGATEAAASTASGTDSFVGAGDLNAGSGSGAFIGAGGYELAALTASNCINASFCNLAAGNQVSGTDSFVGAGDLNIISGSGSFIGSGGYTWASSGGTTAGNLISATDSFIGAGDQNVVEGAESVVGGGQSNEISSSGKEAVIGGGIDNVVAAQKSTIGGGEANETKGSFATIPGGYRNIAAGNESFAAGSQADAKFTGSFVWSDYVAGEAALTDGSADEFVVRASGGVYIYSNAKSPYAGVKLSPGSGTWGSVSDRNAKTDVVPLDDASVLAKVAALPVDSWRYKTESGVRHVGPMAQDFYAAFGVGEDDRHITSIDEDGVALAAIKALNTRLGVQNAEMHAENDRLQTRLARLEEKVERMTGSR